MSLGPAGASQETCAQFWIAHDDIAELRTAKLKLFEAEVQVAVRCDLIVFQGSMRRAWHDEVVVDLVSDHNGVLNRNLRCA